MEIFYQEIQKMKRVEARKKLIKTYERTKNISKTAKLWGTSRSVVRKWLKRYKEKGEKGLEDLSRRPKRSPFKTSSYIEEKVLKIRKERGYGRRRISYFLLVEEGIYLSENTITHILRRNGECRKRKKRRVFYPAKWAFDEDAPFKLAQVDVKDIYDKGTLGTYIWNHITKKKLPRYQWTFLEGRTRLRFIAYSRKLHITNGLCFVSLVMSWLRAWGIKEEVFWQEDWGQEWGGDNLEKLRKLNEKYYKPYGAILGRAPKGRKGYQGRVERSHKTDDEEFYIPLLSSINSERKLLQYAAKWIYWYNVKRPHFGKGMDGRSPFEKLKDLGYNLPEEFALLPPIILDEVSTFWAVRGGNNLLTPYKIVLVIYF
ncbi:MAG: helix-turn-helix domain-containing protein [Thermoplasmata archaeon]|nr:helix-turn-helix domain-containing protein [Thermoplasmata archaeon]